MASNFYNLSGYQGSTLLLYLTINDSTGGYMNLNGYAVSGYAKTNYSTSNILFNLNPVVTSAISGAIRLSGNSVDLAETPVGIYPWCIELSKGDYVLKPIRGLAYIFPEVVNF